MACTASVRTLGKRALRLALLSLIVSAAIINGAVTALAADGDDEAVSHQPVHVVGVEGAALVTDLGGKGPANAANG